MPITVAKRTTEIEIEALEALPRPVAAFAHDYAPGESIPPHRHLRAQLLFAASGIMRVRTERGIWVVPPNRAVWVPAGTEHQINCSGLVRMRTLFVRQDAAPRLGDRCQVVDVPPLLRELILAAVDLPALYDEDGPDGRLMRVVLDRIDALEVAPLHLPMSAHPRLAPILDGLLRHPEDDRGLEDWGHHVGASGRTLARLFQGETGMTFRAWRQQARLLAALTRLAANAPVTSVAFDLGYDSLSAFIAMFRKATGTTPGRYFGRPE